MLPYLKSEWKQKIWEAVALQTNLNTAALERLPSPPDVNPTQREVSCVQLYQGVNARLPAVKASNCTIFNIAM